MTSADAVLFNRNHRF